MSTELCNIVMEKNYVFNVSKCALFDALLLHMLGLCCNWLAKIQQTLLLHMLIDSAGLLGTCDGNQGAQLPVGVGMFEAGLRVADCNSLPEGMDMVPVPTSPKEIGSCSNHSSSEP